MSEISYTPSAYGNKMKHLTKHTPRVVFSFLVLLLVMVAGSSAFAATATGFCSYSTSKQSLWGEGAAYSIKRNDTLLEVPFNLDTKNLTGNFRPVVTILGDDFGADLAAKTEGKIGLYSKVDISGGEADLKYKGTVRFEYPDPRSFIKGATFTVRTSMDENVKHLVTRPPRIMYDLYLAGYISLEAYFKFLMASNEYSIFDLNFDTRKLASSSHPYYTINGVGGNMGATIFKMDSGSATERSYVRFCRSRDELPYCMLQGLLEDAVGTLPGGVGFYAEYSLPFVIPDSVGNQINLEGSFDLPKLEVVGEFNRTQDLSKLAISGSDTFIDVQTDMLGYLPIPEPYNLVLGGSAGGNILGIDYGASYNTYSLNSGLKLKEKQDFEFTPSVTATLNFSAPLKTCVTAGTVNTPPPSGNNCWKTQQSSASMVVGENLHLQYPSGTEAPETVTITPASYALTSTGFRNKTSLIIDKPFSFEWMQAEAHIDDFTLVPEICIPAVEIYACWFWDCGWVTVTPRICTPQVDFPGLNWELGPLLNVEVTPSLTIDLFDKQWNIGGFQPYSGSSPFTLTAGNPPTVSDGTLAVTEDTAKAGTFSASAIIGNNQTFRVITQGQKGTVTIANPATNAFTYTPNANAYGADTFTFKVHDNNALFNVDSNLGTITVNITNVNDVPTGILISKSSVVQASATGTVVGTLTAVDPDLPDHDSHTFTLTDNAGGRFKLVGNELQVDNGALLNYSSATQHSVSVRITDASGLTVTKPLTIQVKSIPVAINGTLAATEDITATGTLAATDQDGETQTYSIVSGPAKGTVVITNAATGAYSYTSGPNFNGTETFTFRSTDASGYLSSIATVTVTVTPANDSIRDITLTPAITGGYTFNTATPYSDSAYWRHATSGDYVVFCGLNDRMGIFRREVNGTLTRQTVEFNSEYLGKASSCSISGDYAIVTVPNISRILVFKRSSADGVWRPSDRLQMYDRDANSVAISGDTIITVAQSATYPRVYYANFYKLNSSTGKWDRVLASNNDGLKYPWAVAISGNRAAFGGSTGNGKGAVLLFERDGNGAWSRTATMDGEQESDYFGSSVAISGDLIVAGAPSNFAARPGFAYAFTRRNDGTWKSTRISPADGQIRDYFGKGVATDGAKIAIGSPNFDSPDRGDAGAIYMYSRDSEDNFSLTRKIMSPAATGHNFGDAVSLMENFDDLITIKGFDTTENLLRVSSVPIPYVNEGANHGSPAEVALGGSVTGTVVGTIAPVDPDLANPDALGTYTFTLTDSAGGRFKLAGTQLQVDNASLLDYENAQLHVVTIRAVDSHGSSFEKKFRIYVKDLNEMPRANAKSVTTSEDTPVSGTLSGTTIAGRTLSYAVDGNPKKGTVTLNSATGAFTYTPNRNLTGTDSFTFKVNDGLLDSLAATVTIQITPVNDTPVAIATLAGETKLTDPAGSGGDQVGGAVAVSGNYALIGASRNSDNASHSGAALFVEKGADGAWQQVLKVKPETQAEASVGSAVAISGNFAIIGAYGHDKSGAADSGLAHIYQRVNGTWTPDGLIDPAASQASDQTGIAVGISGSYAIAGASGVASSSGAVYISERGASVWQTPVKLVPTDGTAGDLFGNSVALSGNYALVGAPGDADKGPFSGSVYIFERNATSGLWEQKAKILAADGVAGDSFGSAVSISGSYAVVGAKYSSVYGMAKAGAAYVYQRAADGAWAQAAKLIAPNGAPGDEFGTSVSLSGDLVTIGDPNDGGKGSVHLFRRNADGTWSQVQRFAASDSAAGDGFGKAVAISGATMLVGAPLADVGAKTDAGKGYLLATGNLAVAENAPNDTLAGLLSAQDLDNGDTFTYTLLSDAGGRFKLDGNRILVANGLLLDYETAASHDIRVKVTDAGGASIEKVITIIVTDINEAPVAQNDTLIVYRDVAKDGTLRTTDQEHDSLTFSLVSNCTKGTAVILDTATGAYRYTPNPGVTGDDSFTYRANDGNLDSAVATVSVQIYNNPNDGLLAYYPCSGNTNDASGNGRHATGEGTELVADRFGIASNACAIHPPFGGSAKYLSLPSFPIGGAFSVAAWVRNDAPLRNWTRMIDFGNGPDNDNIVVGWTDQKMFAGVYNGSNGTLVYSPVEFPQFQWVHVAVSVDATGQLKMYWNGELKVSGATNVPQVRSRTNQYVGKSNWDERFPFYGEIDELRLYNRPLDAADVQGIYQSAQCGASDKGNVTTAPSTNLCSQGVASAVTGNGPWTWSCSAPSGSAQCSANRLVNGVCGAANGMSLDASPTALCTSGTPSVVAGSGPWTWTCTGANTGVTASCTATINAYPLTVGKIGNGSGLVSASTGALAWSGNTATATYNAGATVTLTAIPGENNTFAGWTGACTGTAPCTLTMLAAKDVTAAFVNLNDGLMAYYPFSGSVIDASGNGRNATVYGATLSGDVSGNPDAAYSFNGTSDYIALPSFPIGGEFSVSARVYLDNNSSNWQRLIDFGNGRSDNNLIVGWHGQKMFAEVYDGNSTKKLYSTEVFPQGEWVHVVAAIDAVGNVSIYWNGVQKGEGRINVPSLLYRTNQYIGKSNGLDPYFGGKIDEVRIYSRALTESDVHALYQVFGNCGSSQGANLLTAPTTGLCREGTATAVTGSGPWAWSCTGANGGGSASCSANLKVNGACGPSHGQTFTSAPQTGLCSAGTPSALSGTGDWSWSCQGINAGTDAACTAQIQTYPVTVTITGTGTGTIGDNTGGRIIWNGNIGTGFVKHGALVLTAKPDQGFAVKSWSGSASSRQTYSVMVDGPKTISVEFDTSSLTDNLMLYWPFTGNLNDASGNGNNGNPTNGTAPAPDRFGTVSKAYDFFGGGSIRGTPEIAMATVDSLSISLWFKPASDMGYWSNQGVPEHYLISKGYYHGQTAPQFAVALPEAGKYEIQNGSNKLRATGTYVNGEWTHLVVVFNGPTLTVYENGVQIAEGPTDPITDLSYSVYSFQSDFLLGAGATYGGGLNTTFSQYRGSIDEVMVYNRPLWPVEAQQLYDLDTVKLTVTKSTTGSGTVTSNTGTIKWNGSIGTAKYGSTNNTQVTLTAVADSGSAFTGWSGACSGLGTCTVTMDTAKQVMATFSTLNDGMVAHYPFSGNADDVGSNGLNGTVNGGVTLTTDRSGNANSAYSFNGTNGYIRVEDHDLLDFTGSYAISAWIRPSSFNWLGGIVSKYQTGGSNGVTLRLSSSVNHRGLSFNGMETDDDILTANTWQHILAVNNGGTLSLYVNGIIQPLTGAAFTVQANNDPVMIGVDFMSRYFDGAIDDVRLYNRVVTPDEAMRLSYHTLTVTKSGTGTGSVQSSSTLQWNGSVGTATLFSGQSATLSATPDSNATFTGWTGPCSGTGTCIVTMDGVKSVGAVFTKDITPPTGSISINSGALTTEEQTATLTLTCTDTETGCAQMQFSSNGFNWTTPEIFSASKSWSLLPKLVPLTISNFQPNYQTRLTVPYDSDMRPDFGDLRFIDTTTGANIPYWIESANSGVSASVWFKTGANNTIAMTYGSGSDISNGNPESVFELYDDFNSEISLDKWQHGNPDNGSVSNPNGQLNILSRSGTDYWGTADTTRYLVSKNPVQGDYVVETYISQWAKQSYLRSFSLRSGTATNEKTFFMLRDFTGKRISNGYRETVGGSAGWYGDGTGIMHDSQAGFAQFVVAGDTVSSYMNNQHIFTRTVPGWGLKHVAFTSSNLSDYPTIYDWVRIRKYTATEPTVSLGVEQPWPAYISTPPSTVYVKYNDNAGNWSASYSASIVYDASGPVVTASPKGGNYAAPQTVTLSCVDGAGCGDIYYTTDGSTPTSGSTRYTAPIQINTRTTLKFYAQDTLGHATTRTEVYSFNILAGAVQKGLLNVEPAVVTTLSSVFNDVADITTDGEYLYLTEYSRVLKMSLATGQVSHVAGVTSGYADGSNDGVGAQARFYGARGITTDGANLYLADHGNDRIRKIVIATGEVTTLAGQLYGNTLRDGVGVNASFSGPTAITNDGTYLYVLDYWDPVIRRIEIASGTVTTIAGVNGVRGNSDGIGTSATFNMPAALTTDGANLYVADGSTIRKMDLATRQVTTLAGVAGQIGTVDGVGSAARFEDIQGITTDGTNLYVSDYAQRVVRKVEIATGKVLTIAGLAGVRGLVDGIGMDARFDGSYSVTSDGSNLYVLDSYSERIRKISAGPDTRGSGLIAHYPFNGNADDAGGNAYNGTVSGSALTTDRLSNADSAYSFDGVDDHITLPSFQIGGAFSVSAWVYVNNTATDWQRIMDFGNGQSDYNLVVTTLGQKMGIGSQGQVVMSQENFPQGQWVHLVGVFDDSGMAKVYWNGQLKASGTIGVPPLMSRLHQYIGRSNWDTDPYFSGKIDDLRLYNRALSQSDIQALYTLENGSCGSARDQNFAIPPTINLCNNGTASSVTVNGIDLSWSCGGINGGTTAVCGAKLIPENGSCGSANDQNFAAAPTDNLCSTGSATAVAANGSNFSWSCNGKNTGTATVCGAKLIINGVCGTAAGKLYDAIPTTALCSIGVASAVAVNGSALSWDCNGMNTGSTATCSATMNTYTLTVNKTGSGATSSSVSASTGTLSWNAGTATASYNGSTLVTLTPQPATYMSFVGWSGACSGTGPCTVTMLGAKTVTAQFADLGSELVANYPFHGNANDVSGNGYHGTEHGVISVPDPRNDNILTYLFNDFVPYDFFTIKSTEAFMSQNQPKYIELPTFPLGGAFTVSTWITFDNGWAPYNNSSRIFDFGNGENGSIIAYFAESHIRLWTKDSNGVVSEITYPYGAEPQRNHVTMSVDPTGYMKLYLNGELKASGQGAPMPTLTRNIQSVGKSYLPSDPYYNGHLNEMRIYNRALTDGDVAALFAARDGLCGSANGQTFVSKPDTNLCLRGNPSAVTGSGDSWSWNCSEVVTGTNASCSAVKTTAQTITFTPATMVYGAQPLDLSTLVTGGGSGNPVTFTRVSGPGALSGTNNATLTATGAGAIVVKASQAGAAGYAAATDVQQTITVTKAQAGVALGNLNQVYDGSAKHVTVTTVPANRTVNVTYNDSATVPVNAGSYTLVATINDPIYQGTASGTLVIAKKPVDILLGSLNQTYNGTARAATATTSPAGRTVSFTYNGSATVPVNAGSYAVVATANDANYQGTASGTLTIAKAAATLTLGSLTATYDGTEKPVTHTVNPAGKTVVVKYDNSSAVPVDAGYYFVNASVDDANYAGSATGYLNIAKAAATVTLSNLTATYDGTAKTVSAVTTPEGLPVTITYNGSSTAPVEAGSYAVKAVINDTNNDGIATGTLVIAKAAASITFGNLTVPFDGSPKTPEVTTTPAGLAVSFTYNGLSNAPSDTGSYALEATINDANYQGTASGTFIVSDQIRPVIYSFTALPRAGYLIADTTIVAGGDVAVSGYCLTEGSDSSGCSWSATPPTSYTFATAGPKTLYAYVIAANGKVSLPHGSNLTVSFPILTVTVNGTGSGTVTSVPAGIACTTGICTKSFSGNGTVNLYATPSVMSIFGGWSGGCSGSGSCTINMDGDRSVTATFNQASPVRVGDTDYTSLQQGYDAAATDSIIKVLASYVTGTLNANRTVTIKVKGGFNSIYTTTNGSSIVTGPLIIRKGKVVVDKIVVRK